MKSKVHFVAFGLLAASLPALANTAVDNVVRSARPVAAVSVQPECTAYTGRQIVNTNDSTDPFIKTLKVVGTMAAVGAVSAATKAGSQPAPNPCGGL
ncbi:hypothetical protein [Paraburkholderia sp. BL21I4N1]|uniref:hypothetical protein n=1 Tax=Paraburkholderia sp. BL21I4N1 TaxID=1938801 RepID=UPI000CFD3413|nr:hypothetical protein [Paraburkholderia sp. BL21I4N1]PQV52526.1 hypothetical protein B0G83_103275 [Paraburkholderia sp. BL21I4N1]